MRAVVMGTKQAFQKHGLESALFIKLKEYVLPLNQYEELELSWVGDFNDKMLKDKQELERILCRYPMFKKTEMCPDPKKIDILHW